MTFQEAASLKGNSGFIDRIRVSISKWQDYLINTGVGDPEYNEKVGEGARIASSFETETQKVLNALIGDSQVLALTSGSMVDDPTLSMIVEKYVKAFSPLNTAPTTAMMSIPGQKTVKWEAPAFLKPSTEPRPH